MLAGRGRRASSSRVQAHLELIGMNVGVHLDRLLPILVNRRSEILGILLARSSSSIEFPCWTG